MSDKEILIEVMNHVKNMTNEYYSVLVKEDAGIFGNWVVRIIDNTIIIQDSREGNLFDGPAPENKFDIADPQCFDKIRAHIGG